MEYFQRQTVQDLKMRLQPRDPYEKAVDRYDKLQVMVLKHSIDVLGPIEQNMSQLLKRANSSSGAGIDEDAL